MPAANVLQYLVPLTLALVLLPLPQSLARHSDRRLSDSEKTEVNARLGQLAEAANSGRWNVFVDFLFLRGVPDVAAQLVDHHRRRFPHGLDPQIATIQVTRDYYDTTGTHPAEWTLTIKVTFRGDPPERIYTGNVYASNGDGEWLFTEPDLDGCSDCSSFHVGYPWY